MASQKRKTKYWRNVVFRLVSKSQGVTFSQG